jgi:hypothetical protein
VADQPITIDDVKRLDVKPGDTLVLTCERSLRGADCAAIRTQFDEEYGPGAVRLLVLDGGLRLGGVVGGLPQRPHGEPT